MHDNNGLHAPTYRQLGQLPEHLREPVLTGLAAVGVAAFMRSDWLHVDAAMWNRARATTEQVLDRVAFDDIVAHFDDGPTAEPPRDRLLPRFPPATAAADSPAEPPADNPAEPARQPEPWLPPQEPFVPPEPPRVSLDWVTRFAWFAVFSGPVALIVLTAIQADVDPGLVWSAVAAFGGGILALLLRHTNKPGDDDDGAVL